MTFQKKLDQAMKKHNSLMCVGLDPKENLFEFNKKIIDQTHDLICAYKPNSAFYEAFGAGGIQQLKNTCAYIQDNYPDIPIILDAKRADIGNTNKGYAKFIFEYLGVDAVTLHPYLGREAIQPFLDYKDKGLIILCRTSNTGANEFQDLLVEREPLYLRIAKQVVQQWNKNNNCLLVVGATYPKEMKKIRAVVGDMTFLVPGIGAQGGDVISTVKAGKNTKNRGLIINSSRGIMFAKDPRAEAIKLRDEINKCR